MNPSTGTFLSVDPVVADYADPQSYNAYAYARNNPISFSDPTGMFWEWFAPPRMTMTTISFPPVGPIPGGGGAPLGDGRFGYSREPVQVAANDPFFDFVGSSSETSQDRDTVVDRAIRVLERQISHLERRLEEVEQQIESETGRRDWLIERNRELGEKFRVFSVAALAEALARRFDAEGPLSVYAREQYNNLVEIERLRTDVLPELRRKRASLAEELAIKRRRLARWREFFNAE